MSSTERRPVLILGAGINGAALARELALNGVPVWVVDLADVASGATSRSSRLIHGGLRYLEYGDVRLVRESLEERARLRRLAPQFVHPLRLFVPVEKRATGLVQAAFRFVGASRSPLLSRFSGTFGRAARGLWAVRMGLWMYDRLAADADFPKSTVHRTTDPGVPRVDAARYRWVCGYSDAQMPYTERFVVALLEDARQLAAERGIDFRVLTYHQTELTGGQATIRPRGGSGPVHRLTPPAVVNATGAWGDLTLGDLRIPAPRLFGGTKGSHFITHEPRFREALGDAGVYAEAADGRLIFVLPLGEGILVGTTDERFEGPPDRAFASEVELAYLLDMVNALFPDVRLTRADVAMHYSGVRPLSYTAGGKTAAISRDHFIERHKTAPLPVFTLVGGKLTTCRALAELAADQVFAAIGTERTADSRDRPIPGGEDCPQPAEETRRAWDRLADGFHLSPSQVELLWSLFGARAEAILHQCRSLSGETLSGTEIPLEVVRWIIRHEWVGTLADLVERRLMLLYRRDLAEETLQHLAACLAEADLLPRTDIDATVTQTADRLRTRYGKQTVPAPRTARAAG